MSPTPPAPCADGARPAPPPASPFLRAVCVPQPLVPKERHIVQSGPAAAFFYSVVDSHRRTGEGDESKGADPCRST
ncbi:hypothetical protein GPN2_13821 [Streptomyces murinus]